MARAQEEPDEPPPAETRAVVQAPDTLLPLIMAATQGVSAPDVNALAKALHLSEQSGGAPPTVPANTLAVLGDVDGDGVPELVLRWAIPDVPAGADVAPAPESRPLWAVYLLSWDGKKWQASRLVTGVEDFVPMLINLGPAVGRGVAVTVQEDDPPAAYPAIFQFKDHLAALLWDSQAEDSRYQPLPQGEVRFLDHAGSAAEMVVTGHADPGLLQVDPRGRRGFQVRVLYHWNGKEFSPAKTEYSNGPDYTIYRFISALHLHDYKSAYALVDAAKFLGTDSPTLEAFRKYIEDNWAEFLRDEIFKAPEIPPGSAEQHVFVLPQAGALKVYHPVFSSDGKFLLTGLSRTQEAQPAEP